MEPKVHHQAGSALAAELLPESDAICVMDTSACNPVHPPSKQDESMAC